MKFTSIIATLVLAATVSSAAISPNCDKTGQGCKLKRERAIEPECAKTGQSCHLKRSASALAEAMAEANPEAFSSWCMFTGQGCAKLKRGIEDVAEAKRAAEAEPDFAPQCFFTAQGCKRSPAPAQQMKRSAEALAEAIAEASPEAFSSWCMMTGQGCAKLRRGLDSVAEVRRSADEFAESLSAREY